MYLAGQASGCVDASEDALAHALRAEDTFEQREIAEWLAIAYVLGPHPAVSVERRCRDLLSEVAGRPELEVQFLGTLAYVAGIQGRSGEFAELMERAERKVDVLNEWIWMVPVHFAWVAMARSQSAAAERALRPDYEKLKRLGEKSHFCSFASILAQAVYDEGRYDEAEQLARESMGAMRQNDVHTRIIATSTVAKVLARRGELEPAEHMARDAVAFAETSDFLHAHADALADLAEVLELAGNDGEAAEALAGALLLWERKGNTVAAESARERFAVAG
jgi:ATP/maltotriose-dependent transcriptional regulator MalT